MSQPDLNEALDALQRMRRLYGLMMEKADHGSSFWDAETIREMNEAPIEAERVLKENGREIPRIE